MMMKKIHITFLLLILVINGLFAKPVDQLQAIDAALAFAASWHEPVEAVVDRVEAGYLPDGTVSYYVIAFEGKGWVVISADDVVQPVLAFSFDNSLTPGSEWNESARYLLDGYSEQIGLAIQDKSLKTDAGWEQLKLPSGKKAAGVIIDPFIPVNWNQGNGWNRFCPEDEDGPGGHVYVGCVAVAMAQAMSVYEYPVRARGVKSYIHDTYGSIAVDYDKQDDYAWDSMSHTSSDDFNAMLLYHCAVSVEMNFSPTGSGAYVRTAAGALKNYFGYSQTTKMVDRYDDEDAWKELLISELSDGHPIVYRGEPDDGTAGHAWNLDGYGEGYFHMNFGWSGSQNGYYTINLINPGTSDFSYNQGAIVGMRPPESGPFNIQLSAQTVKESLPEGSFVAAITVDDEDQANIYSYICYGPFSLFDDRRYISQLFYIENDTLFTKAVLNFDSENLTRNFKNILVRVTDQYNNTFEKEFDIEVLENNSSTTDIQSDRLQDASIYPNPARDYIIIPDAGNKNANVSIFDLTGKRIGTYTNQTRVDVSSFDEGLYIVVVEGNDGRRTEKILIQR